MLLCIYVLCAGEMPPFVGSMAEYVLVPSDMIALKPSKKAVDSILAHEAYYVVSVTVDISYFLLSFTSDSLSLSLTFLLLLLVAWPHVLMQHNATAVCREDDFRHGRCHPSRGVDRLAGLGRCRGVCAPQSRENWEHPCCCLWVWGEERAQCLDSRSVWGDRSHSAADR
jgi:hypothetical protein